jgi:hypothetical protein
MKQSRYEQALARLHHRRRVPHRHLRAPAPPDLAELSGTNFLEANTAAASVDAEGISPNGDPLGRGMAPEGGTKQARSNTVRKSSSA